MPHSTESQTIDGNAIHGDWRDDLFRDGYAVVKGVLSAERSQTYIDRMFEWLERFPFGFDRNDPDTWTENHLPTHIKGGMYHGYSVQHEQFMWDARQLAAPSLYIDSAIGTEHAYFREPAVIEAFSRLWGTDKLLVSFDGMNFTLPSSTRAPGQPWPHVDQSPQRKGLQCVQGILNFAPNGPNDGGLIVMKGSHTLNEKFFSTHNEVIGRKTWGPTDWFGFDESEVQWFQQKGCETVKVCAEPGDLILWDSRTVHYNVLPQSNNLRALAYICYTPASFASADDLKLKAELFQERIGSTHWPHANIFKNADKKLRLGKPDLNERDRPFEEPEHTELVLKLSGCEAY